MKNPLVLLQNKQVAKELTDKVEILLKKEDKELAIKKVKLALFNLAQKNSELSNSILIQINKKYPTLKLTIPDSVAALQLKHEIQINKEAHIIAEHFTPSTTKNDITKKVSDELEKKSLVFFDKIGLANMQQRLMEPQHQEAMDIINKAIAISSKRDYPIVGDIVIFPHYGYAPIPRKKSTMDNYLQKFITDEPEK